MPYDELMRKSELARGYKNQVVSYIKDLNALYDTRRIDYRTYQMKMNERREGKTPLEWIAYYDALIERYRQSVEPPAQERRVLPIVLSVVLLMVLGAVTLLNPSITGLYTGIAPEIHEDGYHQEGEKWLDIKGERMYERCMKVSSPTPFTEVELRGKIMTATDEDLLQFILYNHDAAQNEPGLEVGACTVKNREGVWKSCVIKKDSPAGEYWICASARNGDPESTYYTIAYQSGDDKRTAFWTGKNWQKLEWNSYTLKALFRNYG